MLANNLRIWQVVTLGFGLLITSSDAVGQKPNSKRIHQFTLQNGLQVSLRPVSGASETAVVVLYEIGELHDPAGKSGLAHLVEHLYVTSAAGNTRVRTSREYFQAYPSGANAQTGSDATIIASVVPFADLESELKDAASRMSELKIVQADLDREIPRMLLEVSNMFENIASLVAMNLGRQAVNPNAHSGRKGGQPDQITKLSLEDTRQFWQKFYRPRNARLVLAGKLDLEQAEKQISELFGTIETGQPTPAVPKVFKSETRVIEKTIPNGNETMVSIAMKCPRPDSDLYPEFLATVGLIQISARKISKDMKRYPVTFAPLDDPDTIYLRAWADKKDSGELESAEEVATRLHQFLDEIEAKDVAKKARLAKTLFAVTLATSPVSDFRLRQNIYGVGLGIARRQSMGLDPEELAAKLDKLSEAQIEKCLSTFFGRDKRAVVMIRAAK